jgi:squalene-hopene/tetraprenyl-beta-curcumene cyclase
VGQAAEPRSEQRSSAAVTYSETGLEQRIVEALGRATHHLLSVQAPEGYWQGELEADATLESDYIFYLHVLGKIEGERIAKLANYIRRKQLPDGGWSIYEGGPAGLDATIKAYFALKLAGDSPEAAHMALARRRVHELGGLEQANSYTRIYLALCGVVGWERVPVLPTELVLLPRWFYVNIYSMSSWTRAIVIPLLILYALKPRWVLAREAHLDELFRSSAGRAAAFKWDRGIFSWRNLFLGLDLAFRLHERFPWKPLRKRALRRAERWLLEHLERSDGLGAIYPAMMNSVFALLALGYSPDDPLTAREAGHLARLEIEEGDTLRLQPCLSPVWDTAVSMTALEEAGLAPGHPALVSAAQWLLEHQVLSPGDWKVRNPNAEPGGWAFEFRNDFFPDLDDTAFVLVALQRVAYPDRARLEEAVRRGLAWTLSMQNGDGGWGAFERNNNCAFLTRVPFADHNAMIDPSTADLTARVLECLGRQGWPASHPVVNRAIKFLERDQTEEGAWYGRWGVNYIYGTSTVLRAMETLGLAHHSCCERAASWLRAMQNPDGGWGESCASYDHPELKGQGESTPSQTAWALVGLQATGARSDPAVTRGLCYLLDRQKPDGTWDEKPWTGTGFPRVFYLKYHLYRNTFPLYALARWRNLMQGAREFQALHVPPEKFYRPNGHRRS